MVEKLKLFFQRVMNAVYRNRDIPGLAEEVKVSDRMVEAITAWTRVFYREPPWAGFGLTPTNFAASLTGYMATLATNEITVDAGTGARAGYINDQLQRFLLPGLRNAVQLAGVSGQVIVKPFVSGGNILVDTVGADRFYPTRINAAGTVEAGFFTDYAQLHGRLVVRVERFDLQPQGVYIQNRAYYETAGALSAPLSLADVPEWSELAPDALIQGVDRPLFAVLKMPFANTVDPTSRMPVGFYANSMGTLEELDRIYSEFLYEVHSGKRKRIVDRDAIRPEQKKPGGIGFKDLASDVYITLDMDKAAERKPFDDYSPELRVEGYQKAIDMQLRLLESQTGISPGTFTFDVKTGRMTATQVVSDDRDTYNTIKAIQDTGLKAGLADLVYIYDVYASLYSLAPGGRVEASVGFGDSIFEDTGVEYARRKQLADSGYLRPELLVGWYFNISPEKALEEYMPPAAPPMFPDGLEG